jgi:molybdate transport system permease protein
VSRGLSPRTASRLFALALAGSAGLTLTFLLLPVLALFLRIPPGELLSALGSDVALDALWVTVKTGAIAHVFVLGLGTPTAYLLATRAFRGRSLVITAIELPLVLPPAVAGIALFAVFGRNGLLGDTLSVAGIAIPFTQAAVVLAVAFVATPFYVRQAIEAFAAVDRNLLDASRTLGAGPGRTFWRIARPLAAGGLSAGSALAWARGTGEFGATIIFAGSLQGLTQTLPLAIYAELDQDFETAVAIGALLVAFSLAILVTVKLLPSWTHFSSRSITPSARTGSPSSSR